jgi:hypothetical protein
MGHLQRLSNWNVRSAITRRRTAQVPEAIRYFARAKAQSNQPNFYSNVLQYLESLEISGIESELAQGVSMLNVSPNSEEQLRQLRRTFHKKFSLIDVPVPVPLLAALVPAPREVNPAAAEAEPQLEGPPGAPRVVAAPQLPQHRAAPTPAAPTPAAPTPAAAEPPAAPTPAAPTPEAIARDQGVTVAQARIDGWRARAVALSRAGSDGPACVLVEARDNARAAHAGPTPGAVDAFVEGFVSTVHAAASQAVAEDIASWVSQAVNNDRDNLVNAVRRQGPDRVLAFLEPRGREQLVHNGITAGPYFQNALASYVAHMTTIASSTASADLEHRATTGPTADLELEEQGVRRGVKGLQIGGCCVRPVDVHAGQYSAARRGAARRRTAGRASEKLPERPAAAGQIEPLRHHRRPQGVCSHAFRRDYRRTSTQQMELRADGRHARRYIPGRTARRVLLVQYSEDQFVQSSHRRRDVPGPRRTRENLPL